MNRQRRATRCRSWLGIATLTVLAMLTEAPASAQRVVHRARFGETIAQLSREYYGRADYAMFIRLTNGRDNRALRAGERVRVPTAWTYIVPRRTTVSRLAKRLLGARNRAVALSLFNNLGRRRRLRAGERITVPFTVQHRSKPAETFAAISSVYYGNAAQAELIADYNGLQGPQPPAGSRLEIPISRVRIVPNKLLGLTNVRLLGVSPERQHEDREALQEANGLMRRGEYHRVFLRLIRLLAREQPSDTYTAEVYKLLGTAYVALDQPALAVQAFREALLRQPTMTLDAVSVSPKVIRAFADAKARRSSSADTAPVKPQ